MAKDRESITSNGRAVFYASLWNDLRQAAMDCGWALGLHGSLNCDMDIMAMPWTEEAVEPIEMIKALEGCLYNNGSPMFATTLSHDKPNNRAVYTIHIWADFYLDINMIRNNFTNP